MEQCVHTCVRHYVQPAAALKKKRVKKRWCGQGCQALEEEAQRGGNWLPPRAPNKSAARQGIQTSG